MKINFILSARNLNVIFQKMNIHLLNFTQHYRDHLDSTFLNVKISLRIFLSLMVSNCTGEQSFSKLKLFKNKLCSSTLQQRLNYLSIMSIEPDVF